MYLSSRWCCFTRSYIFFSGRVGLFQNQPGDKLLREASLVITIGFNPVEYDPEIWNQDNRLSIIHIHETAAVIRQGYQPIAELIGNIDTNLGRLTSLLNKIDTQANQQFVTPYHNELLATINEGKNKSGQPIHPLRFIAELT